MPKRRRLTAGQKAIIIYDRKIGYVQEPAIFKSYRRIMFNDVSHEIPVFEYGDIEITGLDCFWVLPEDVKTPERIEKIQYELIGVQIASLELSRELGYEIPTKMDDKIINKVATENVDRMQSIIKKLGFDPRDDRWIMKELAVNKRESNWFAFETDNALVFSSNWDDIVAVFNREFSDDISPDMAKQLSKKRMRYILGAYYTRMSGNPQKKDWIKAAKDFEEYHRGIENRMLTWTLARKGKFPMVRTIQEVSFWPGPYFHQCIEKIPHIFTSLYCTFLKPGIVLRVISYDPQEKYIRLDLTIDLRCLIKPDEPKDAKIWIKDRADYDIWIKPEEIGTHLEILEPLT